MSRPTRRVKIKFQVSGQEKFPEERYGSKYSSFTPKSRVYFSLKHEYLYHSGSSTYSTISFLFRIVLKKQRKHVLLEVHVLSLVKLNRVNVNVNLTRDKQLHTENSVFTQALEQHFFSL